MPATAPAGKIGLFSLFLRIFRRFFRQLFKAVATDIVAPEIDDAVHSIAEDACRFVFLKNNPIVFINEYFERILFIYI